jgi:hypothetical protein
LFCSSFLFVFALVLAGCAASPKVHDSHANHQASANPTPRVPAHFNSPEEAKPLPAVLDPKQFSDPVIVAAYGYARENPDVFAQQPCYCYCDSGELHHKSLLDCYASDHSVGCALCLKEGLLVHKLVTEGKSSAEIRDLIVRGDWQNVKLEVADQKSEGDGSRKTLKPIR